VKENQAIALLKRGDISGLETLVNLYQLKALRTVTLITGDLALAEDIVQSAFIRAAERIDQFDSRLSFGPWFLRSVSNDAIKAIKWQKRQVSIDEDNQEDLAFLIDPNPLPEESAELSEAKQVLWQALQALPPKQRAAVVMRYYLGMSESEMVVELKRPAGTVKWRLHSARKRLKQILRPNKGIYANSNKPDKARSESEQEVGD
jgi:RNA polymerase sigma-70 factor (ECF subfamily)